VAEIHLGGGLVSQRLMQTLGVVLGKIIPQTAPGVIHHAVVLEIDLVLDAPPQTLHKDIVKRTAPAIHADRPIRGLQATRLIIQHAAVDAQQFTLGAHTQGTLVAFDHRSTRRDG